MSTVDPPVPSTPPPQQITLPRATIVTPPPGFASLNIGAKIDGVVAQILSPTNVVLSTSFGDVTLSLPARLPITLGQPVLLHLLSGGQQPKVQLSGPGGAPLPTQPGQPQPALPGQVAGSPLGTPAPAVETALGTQSNAGLAIGKTAIATILRPVSLTPNLLLAGTTTPGAQPQTGASTPATGTAQPTQVQPPAQPPTQSAGGTGTTPAAGTSTPAPQAQPGTSTTPAGPNTNIPAGSTLSVLVNAIKLPDGGTPVLTPPDAKGPISLAPGATLVGTVSGKQGVGQTVVQTHAGPLSLPTTEALPKGTQVTLQVVSLQAAQGTDKPSILPTIAETITGGNWPALDDALRTLTDVAPAAQSHILQAAIPRGDAQTIANVLFFVAALRGGDLKGWMGDGPLRILERHRPDVLGRLRDDLGQMSRLVNDPDTGDWRMHAVPYLNGDEIDRIRMLVREREADGDEDTEKPGGTRFVIDLNLTRLGHMQIDGLVATGGKRVDVILRTDDALATYMRDDIRKLYANALEVTGIEGSVGFQAQPGNFVGIPNGPPPENETESGVVI